MIDDNKDVTDSECQKAWMALTKAEKQVGYLTAPSCAILLTGL